MITVKVANAAFPYLCLCELSSDASLLLGYNFELQNTIVAAVFGGDLIGRIMLLTRLNVQQRQFFALARSLARAWRVKFPFTERA